MTAATPPAAARLGPEVEGGLFLDGHLRLAGVGANRAITPAARTKHAPARRRIARPRATELLPRVQEPGCETEPVDERQFEQWQLPAYRNASGTR